MSDAATMTATLGGTWHGSYGVAACPICQPERRRGQCGLSLRDRADGVGILAHCFKIGCDFRDIIKAAGLAPGAFTASDPHALLEAERKRKAEAEKRAAQAHRLWQEARPIGGTLAETYLRAGRGISCPLPATLRFHPSCWHKTAQRFPALVAAVEGADGCAAHRTYLRPDGSGKADVKPNKAMLGAVAGGAVRLSDGPGRLVICEGIETGLSLLCGLLEGPATILAALSTSGMKGLRLPAQPGHLTIAPDGDAPGREAAHALAARAHALGWAVAFLAPPAGADWNDALMGRAVA